jgi:hypothetical protein
MTQIQPDIPKPGIPAPPIPARTREYAATTAG